MQEGDTGPKVIGRFIVGEHIHLAPAKVPSVHLSIQTQRMEGSTPVDAGHAPATLLGLAAVPRARVPALSTRYGKGR